MLKRQKQIVALLLALLRVLGCQAEPAATPRLGPSNLAVVINTRDPLSRQIGAYYAAQRRIPRGNITRVSFDYQRDELPVEQFAAIKTAADGQLKSNVQAYVLTWARPYKVGCMSITSAFALGTDQKYCASECRATAKNPYFNSLGSNSGGALQPRPRLAMSLAATSFENARTLIDRGVRSDGSAPLGSAYLVTTQDGTRNVRSLQYPLAIRVAQHEFEFNVRAGVAPRSADDVMFYFIGAAAVPDMTAYRFHPGAIADHLTSFGGMLTDSPQMSSLRWLEAGATGSYGTVVEPCNMLGKFPNVAVLLAHYLAGETLIESYWKSVEMPGQGIFLGEPLAAPFRKP